MTAQPENRPAAGSPRSERGQFVKGISGNPGGRAKGLASAIREAVPASALAEHFMAIWTRDRAALARLKIPIKSVTLAERNKAGEWLSDHGYGKAPAYAPVEGGDPLELGDLDRAIADAAAEVVELASRREARDAGEAEGGSVAATG